MRNSIFYFLTSKIMVTATKELLQRSDIRTMKKDIQRLKEFGSVKQGTILHPALQGIVLYPVKQSEKIIEPKIIEQTPKLVVEQPKISTPENKPKQKIEPVSPAKVFKENLSGQVTTQNIVSRPVQITTPIRQPDLPIATIMPSVKPITVRQASNSPDDGQKIAGEKIVDTKTTNKDISIKPTVKEKKRWSLSSMFSGQKKAEVKKEFQPQSNLKPSTSIELKPLLLTLKPTIEAKIVTPSTNNIIKPQQVSTIAKENPVPQQQKEVVKMSNVAITSPPVVKEKKIWSLSSMFSGQKKAEVKKESQPQSNLKPSTLIELKPVLLTLKPTIESKIVTTSTNNIVKPQIETKIVIPTTNNIIKPQQVSTIVKENPVPQQQKEVVKMSNVAITSPPVVKENEYLEKIPLATIEKPQTTIKTEGNQRKKFMEDVENWAASNKN